MFTEEGSNIVTVYIPEISARSLDILVDKLDGLFLGYPEYYYIIKPVKNYFLVELWKNLGDDEAIRLYQVSFTRHTFEQFPKNTTAQVFIN